MSGDPIRQGALVERDEIACAVDEALEQVATRIRGDYTLHDFHEALRMAVHDATTCLADLLPTGHES